MDKEELTDEQVGGDGDCADEEEVMFSNDSKENVVRFGDSLEIEVEERVDECERGESAYGACAMFGESTGNIEGEGTGLGRIGKSSGELASETLLCNVPLGLCRSSVNNLVSYVHYTGPRFTSIFLVRRPPLPGSLCSPLLALCGRHSVMLATAWFCSLNLPRFS